MHNLVPIKAVLFDLDDALWPIAAVIRQAEHILHEWLAIHTPEVNRRFTVESLRAQRAKLMAAHPRFRIDLWSLRHAVLCSALQQSGEDVAKAELAMAVFSEARNAVLPFDDVLPGLARLSSKVLLGSISNGFADLQAIGLAHHFQVSIAAHLCGRAKPDPAIFTLACEQLHVKPSEAVYVGDDLSLDVEGAQKAGLRAVWMNRFGRSAPDNIRPDAICTTLDELEQWLSTHATAAH